MNEELLSRIFKSKRACSTHQLARGYKNFIKIKKLLPNQRIVCSYGNIKLSLTQKQIAVLKLVAQGFSNVKIAKKLEIREPAVKLLIYRLMKHLEYTLYEKVDRFYLIVIAQTIQFNTYPTMKFDPSRAKAKYN